jgi:hypothetical protein
MCARVIFRAATILSMITVVLLGCRSQRLSGDRGGVKARPLTARKFERNPERLRRGSYLVNGVAACFTCHGLLTSQNRGRLQSVEKKAKAMTGDYSAK